MDEGLADLDARAAVFPLVCRDAFDSAATTIDKGLRQRAAEHLREHADRRSRASLDLIVERACGPNDCALSEHVQRWASKLLVDAGRGVEPRHHPQGKEDASTTHADAVLRWRRASLHVPAALLLGAVTAGGASRQLVLGTPAVRRLLSEEPWAEIHLHANAATDFDSWWVEGLVEPIGRTKRTLEGRSGDPTGKARQAAHRERWRCAGLLRFWLCQRLLRPIDGPALREELWREVAARSSAAGLDRALVAVARGALPDTADVIDLAALADAVGLPRSAQGAVTGHRDASLCGHHETEVELVRRFMAAISKDDTLEKVFWQYQRLRKWAHDLVVERPGVPGLGEFRDHYQEIGSSRDGLFERAHRLQKPGMKVAALEVRPAMPKDHSLPKKLRQLAESAATTAGGKAAGSTELGVVLSLIKPSKPEDGKPVLGSIRFSKPIAELAAAVENLAAVLSRVPETLLLLRGIDIASEEIFGPTWLMAPFLREARQCSSSAADRLARLRPDWEVPRLRVTAHAGEESLGPITGLRRIDELLQSDTLREGDRIGHGLALGFAAHGRHDAFVQPREERIFDLLWSLDMAERGEVEFSGGHLAFLRAEAKKHALVLGIDATVDQLCELPHKLLHCEYLTLKQWRTIPPQGPWIHPWLTSERVYVKLAESIEVNLTSAEREGVELLRRAVVRAVSRLEIVVEVNPSSNLLVGDLASIREHPMFRLSPLDERGVETIKDPRVAVALCDDDPISFATRLADEVAYTHAALRQHDNVSSEAACRWLDQARQAAMRARFTVAASAKAENLAELARLLK